MSEKVRYSYIWFPEERGTRDAYVLSIARKFNKDNSVVKWGWALNVPGSWVDVENSKFSGREWVAGDHFSRKAGRKIAEERMEKEPHVSWVDPNSLPIEVILANIENGDFPIKAKEIARQELDRWFRARPPQQAKLGLLDKFMNWLRGA